MGDSQQKKFSVRVTGSGRLISSVFYFGMERYPDATWYDFSDRIKTFIAGESRLAKRGYLNPEGRRNARRAEQNLRNPPRVDIKIDFRELRQMEVVFIRGRKGNKALRFDFTAPSANFDFYARQVLSEMKSFL
jgi:hypothetical protein